MPQRPFRDISGWSSDSIAGASDKKQIDQEDGDENKGSDNDVKRFDAQDALLGREIGRWDMSLVVVVSVIRFWHGYQDNPQRSTWR
jgi:hypothetical protein